MNIMHSICIFPAQYNIMSWENEDCALRPMPVCMNGCTCMHALMDYLMNRWIILLTGGLLDGRVDGWAVDGWMDG